MPGPSRKRLCHYALLPFEFAHRKQGVIAMRGRRARELLLTDTPSSPVRGWGAGTGPSSFFSKEKKKRKREKEKEKEERQQRHTAMRSVG
jgi:hypothetical protein